MKSTKDMTALEFAKSLKDGARNSVKHCKKYHNGEHTGHLEFYYRNLLKLIKKMENKK